MKHLLKMSDLTPDEVAHILDVADELKAQQKAGGTEPLLKGKSVALMFSKNSTRTRTSFEVGVYQLGGCWVAIMTALSGAPTAKAIWKSSLSLRASPSSMA